MNTMWKTFKILFNYYIMHKEANFIKIAGVIGDPINHTRSPLIHNYWIKKIILIASIFH